MERPVLILGAEPRVVVTIARSLHRHGIPVWAAACSERESLVSSRALTRTLRLPSPQHDLDHFGIAVLKTVQDGEVDMVLPSNDTALGGLAAQYATLKAGFDECVSYPVHLGCPPPAAVRRVLDKSATLAAARRCGIEVPFTVEVNEHVELDGLVRGFRYPAIVKPRNKAQSGSSKIRHAQTAQDLQRILDRDRPLRAGALVQEFCVGNGVGIELLMHQGQPIAIFQHRRVKELPASGGVSVLSISEPLNPELASQAVSLLRELEWEGVAMVEFRYDPTGRRAVLMEVNGRYWGSLALPVLSGLDFPYYEWQLAHGHRPIVPERYRIGIRCRWTRGLLLRAQETSEGEPTGSTGLFAAVKDFSPGVRDAVWSVTDPSPAIRELAQTLSGWLRALARAGMNRVLPATLIDLLRGYRLLGPRDGRIFLQRALLRLVRLQRDSWEPLPDRVGSVLFVCHGNILRSPMAAALLTHALASDARPSIASAGLHAKPYGEADERGRTVAVEFGCSLEAHESQMVSKDMVERADVVFVMDRFNEAKLLGRFPQAKRKVRLLGVGDADAMGLDITDPYDGELEDVRRCYERLARCIRQLALRLGGPTTAASIAWETPPTPARVAGHAGEQA